MKKDKDIFDRIMEWKILSIFNPFYKKYKEVLLYLFFGGLTTFISIGSYAFFDISMHMDPMIANIFSWILAVLFAAAFTALIQSSGAAVGILSALATKGLVPFSTAAFMVCGLNIGTCITAVLASVTGCRNSKRIATFHVLFNLVGTIFFLIICSATPLLSWIAEFSGTPAHQVANFHTVFNIVTTVIMLPFDAVFMKLIYKLPIKGEMLAEGSLIEE